MKKTKNQECWIKFPEKANPVAAQTKTVDSNSESTVLPVTPEIAKKLAEELKIEVDGKYLKFNLNNVDLNAYGITAFEAFVFNRVVCNYNYNLVDPCFCDEIGTCLSLQQKGYVKKYGYGFVPSYLFKGKRYVGRVGIFGRG